MLVGGREPDLFILSNIQALSQEVFLFISGVDIFYLLNLYPASLQKVFEALAKRHIYNKVESNKKQRKLVKNKEETNIPILFKSQYHFCNCASKTRSEFQGV